jgi:diaminopimelate epimerase
VKFTKLQATGNDFILIGTRGEERDWVKLARDMCHRHLGIGADGLLLVLPSSVADLRLRVLNPDGSEAEACGNGMRCLVKYAVDLGIVPKEEFEVETLAGLRKIRPHILEGEVIGAEVAMGEPRFEAGEIPLLAGGGFDMIPVLNYPLDIGGERLSLTFVSMGNPHAVCFSEEPVGTFPLGGVGPLLEHHSLFPQGMNFEVANIYSRRQIATRVWERGVGETLSCGSGACAVAVAAQLNGYVDQQVDIMLPGGTLHVYWDGAGEVLLSGAVEFVFTGEWIKEG